MRKSRGFSLVELMIAMVVGLVIILGAGQLFLTVFTNNQRVDTLGEKQAAVNFSIETLLRDIRRADWSGDEWSGEVLALGLNNRDDVSVGCPQGSDIVKHYRLKKVETDKGSQGVLESKVTSCVGGSAPDTYQEIVGGFLSPDDNGFDIDDSQGDDGVLKVILRLVPTSDGASPDSLVFYAVNRSMAVNGKESDEEGEGEEDEGEEDEGEEDEGEEDEDDDSCGLFPPLSWIFC